MSDFFENLILTPLSGRVLVRVKGNSPTTGKIIIPSTAKNVPVEGTVIQVSEGIYENGAYRPHSVHIGDHVLFKWGSGMDLVIENEEYRVMHESEIILKMKGVNYE